LVTTDTFIETRRKITNINILPEKPSGYYVGELDICGRNIMDITEVENDTVGDAGLGFMVNGCGYGHGPSGPRTVTIRFSIRILLHGVVRMMMEHTVVK
jgi:hypothetical protein